MEGQERLMNEVKNSLNQSEKDYYDFHKGRYRRFDIFLDSLDKGIEKNKSVRVLEIGSHYLHSSVLLAHRGYEVDAMDVQEFWDIDFVQKRGRDFNLNPIIENDLSQTSWLENCEEKYDLIVFTEILEHITFNPVQFWKSAYKSLKAGGLIYISTPNSFALPNFTRSMKNLLLFKSIGITVDDILSKVTYGHHWKEYSAKEVKLYFERLSPDFEVVVNPYHYKNYDLRPPFLVFKVLSRLGNLTKLFADDLEVIVTLTRKTSWTMTSPKY
ncbi:class I SAM-dependent methyltransferase [Algoriphagus namhaensis]